MKIITESINVGFKHEVFSCLYNKSLRLLLYGYSEQANVSEGKQKIKLCFLTNKKYYFIKDLLLSDEVSNFAIVKEILKLK